MNITLIAKPTQEPVTWDNFVLMANPYSIALDGFVYGPPRFHENEKGPYINFNHHEEVDRLGTRATCAQVLMAVRQGLFKKFNKDITIHVNDCDQDVCMSTFILKNHWLAENAVNPRLNRLVHVCDMLDTCAGSYPFHIDMPILKELAWIFEPYTKFRLSGQLHKKKSDEYVSIITDVENRLMKHVMGEGEERELDTALKILDTGKDGTFSVIKEIGRDSRVSLHSHNIHAFVSVLDETPGKYRYSIGKTSMFFPFDLQKIYSVLNMAEIHFGKNDIDKDVWGGSNTIGGSPRVSGSMIPPDKIKALVDHALETKQ
jgi:hypothetical protein